MLRNTSQLKPAEHSGLIPALNTLEGENKHVKYIWVLVHENHNRQALSHAITADNRCEGSGFSPISSLCNVSRVRAFVCLLVNRRLRCSIEFCWNRIDIHKYQTLLTFTSFHTVQFLRTGRAFIPATLLGGFSRYSFKGSPVHEVATYGD